MELLSVVLARAIAWVEPAELNPKGAIFYPDLAHALVARYGFQKFPQTFDDFNEAKGVTFTAGRIGESVIDQVIIYAYGIVLDTRSSTQESRRLLEEALLWGSNDLGLVYKPSMIKRWQYASNITFRSDVPLATAHSAFLRLAGNLSEAISEGSGEKLEYEAVSIAFDYDQLLRKHPLGRFSIQRRENTPFSENKYFSDAPLPTDIHIALLEQLEADIQSC
ncbi:MAG: hypothetical protein ACRECH_12630 [Nitrososphaerales archaeon]